MSADTSCKGAVHERVKEPSLKGIFCGPAIKHGMQALVKFEHFSAGSFLAHLSENSNEEKGEFIGNLLKVPTHPGKMVCPKP